jgi:hypothetical protein
MFCGAGAMTPVVECLPSKCKTPIPPKINVLWYISGIFFLKLIKVLLFKDSHQVMRTYQNANSPVKMLFFPVLYIF